MGFIWCQTLNFSFKSKDINKVHAFEREQIWSSETWVTTSLVHTGRDRHEKQTLSLDTENPLQQQNCPHYTQQAMRHATCVTMGTGSIFCVALLPVWMGPQGVISNLTLKAYPFIWSLVGRVAYPQGLGGVSVAIPKKIGNWKKRNLVSTSFGKKFVTLSRWLQKC